MHKFVGSSLVLILTLVLAACSPTAPSLLVSYDDAAGDTQGAADALGFELSLVDGDLLASITADYDGLDDWWYGVLYVDLDGSLDSEIVTVINENVEFGIPEPPFEACGVEPLGTDLVIFLDVIGGEPFFYSSGAAFRSEDSVFVEYGGNVEWDGNTVHMVVPADVLRLLPKVRASGAVEAFAAVESLDDFFVDCLPGESFEFF